MPRKYWLKMIGETANPVAAWDEPHIEFPGRRVRVKGKERIEGKPQVHGEDRMVLYATQHGRLFAIVRVISKEPYRHNDPNRFGNWSVDVAIIGGSNVPVTKGPVGTEIDSAFVGVQNGYKAITFDQYKKAAIALGVSPEDW